MSLKNMFSAKKAKGVTLDLSEKEARYLSALVEAQVSRWRVLGKEEIEKKKSRKEAYQVFNKIGEILSA